MKTTRYNFNVRGKLWRRGIWGICHLSAFRRKERKRKMKDEEYFDTRKRFIYVMQRSRQTGQRSLHWKRNFSWDIVGEVEFSLKNFKEWSQIFRIFEIVVTSVRNMWRQRSPCTSGWPATLLMKSFKKNPLILSEPKLCFIKRKSVLYLLLKVKHFKLSNTNFVKLFFLFFIRSQTRFLDV